ncbi:HTH-type transcriptional regulator DmlR [BD1-7 clade bacterium]|uniref:HTH-type transcriptional regulator DmlR n=1 Tax=BD1-7 clade bacterium TaxID=2029982 RepID=A0A5S9NPS4_9GAMM|nr:HTH-type transcriptional regulator DmlR [BD1-7 clade bacterium]
MIDLNDMLIFAKVADLQGISPAARALKMPKSKVSRRMTQLEDALGVRLLERSTRSVHVTEAGQRYLRHCQRVAEEADSALESVHQLADTPRGRLRISTSVAIGQYLIAPYTGDFMQTYPDVDLDIDLTNRRVDLIAEGFDLVVRVGQLNDSTLVSKRLGYARAGLYAAPSYVERHGSPNRPSDLADHKTLVMSDASRMHEWSLERTKVQKKNSAQTETMTVEISPCMSINDFTSLRAIVAGGGGIANFPSYLVEDLVQSGELIAVLPDWKSPPINYFVLYPSHRGLTRKAKVWIEFFADKLRDVIFID